MGTKNSMVYIWIVHGVCLLYSNLPGLQKRKCVTLICILHNFPRYVQHWMGIFANKSHESCSFPNLFSKKKSNYLLKIQDKLNNLRNSFTFIANFAVLGMGLIIFKIMNSPFWEYRIISYVVAGLGLSTSLFFLWKIK
jgi:hypothetical protein